MISNCPDILSQPEALKTAVEQFDPALLAPLAEKIHDKDFDRIVITGMGGSLFASYPVWLILAKAGLPALWVDTAELIDHTPGLVTAKTLLWMVSQSGRSAEIVSGIGLKPAALFATVNDMESPLAKAAHYYVPIRAGDEHSVSTRTYVNTLAVGQLSALVLLGRDVETSRKELLGRKSICCKLVLVGMVPVGEDDHIKVSGCSRCIHIRRLEKMSNIYGCRRHHSHLWSSPPGYI